MKKILLILIAFIPISCFGQKTTQENDDSLYLKKQLFLFSNLSTSNQSDVVSGFNRNHQEFNFSEDYKIPQSYYLPLLRLYQPDNFFNQYLLDLNLTNKFMITDYTSISTEHIQHSFIGLGGLNLIQGEYNFNVGDLGVLSAGIYAAKFNIYNDFFNDGGINGTFKINFTDRLSFYLFGQHSITSSGIAISPFISPLYPHSDFGGSLEFKVNHTWGLMMGAENEYDVFLRKWVTRPFVMPLFYK